MMHCYKLFLVVFMMGTFGYAQSQDIHFSQFYMSPTTLNPALTGVMNCNTRIVGNYRSQWSPILQGGAYKTYSVSYDQKVAVGRYDYFGFGANFWNDSAGDLDYGSLTGKLLGAYSKRVGGSRKVSHYVSFGVEAGVTQRGFDISQATWANWWDGQRPDPNLGSGEIIQFRDRYLFADVGLGALWFSVLDKSNFYIGGALNHVNQANISSIETEVVSYFTRTVLHAGGELYVNNKFSLVPGIVTFMQGPSFELNGGTSFRFNMGNSYSDQSFQIGAWVRLANQFEQSVLMDAVILSTRFDMEQFGFGFSYDINTSSLRTGSNANGAFEFSAVYYVCGPQSRGVYCPKF